MPLLCKDPAHWRERAEEARALAAKMTDASGKSAMIEIAEKYDRLAARAVERLALNSFRNLINRVRRQGGADVERAAGRIQVTVLGMVAEMERRFILERQRTGIEAARAGSSKQDDDGRQLRRPLSAGIWL